MFIYIYIFTIYVYFILHLSLALYLSQCHIEHKKPKTGFRNVVIQLVFQCFRFKDFSHRTFIKGGGAPKTARKLLPIDPIQCGGCS